MSDDFTLTLSKEQARILVDALDLYSRIGMGRLDPMIDVYDHGFQLSGDDREYLRHRLDQIRSRLGFAPGAHHGIHNPSLDDRFRVAWDILQVVRHAVAWSERPAGNPMSVRFDEPRQSSQHPLPAIARSSPPPPPPEKKEDSPFINAVRRLPTGSFKKTE